MGRDWVLGETFRWTLSGDCFVYVGHNSQKLAGFCRVDEDVRIYWVGYKRKMLDSDGIECFYDKCLADLGLYELKRRSG